MTDEEARRHCLRAGFDGLAEDYERTRPVCPPQLFDDLILLAGLRPGDRVIEIGCGTGQATAPLAERGLAVTGIELGAELAAVARRRLAPFPAADVITSAFEDWEPPGTPAPGSPTPGTTALDALADAVLAVNALHWIDPELRYAKPHALLRPGGTMAVAGCQYAQPPSDEPFWADVQEDYRAVGYEGGPPPPAGQIGLRHFPAEAASFFDEVASLRYPFEMTYSANDYLANLATQSGTHALGDERSAEFLARVTHRLESHGWPRLTKPFVAYLIVGRRT